MNAKYVRPCRVCTSTLTVVILGKYRDPKDSFASGDGFLNFQGGSQEPPFFVGGGFERFAPIEIREARS
jgi:hypothetical protein